MVIVKSLDVGVKMNDVRINDKIQFSGVSREATLRIVEICFEDLELDKDLPKVK